jgi:hypothetical protein
VITYSFYDPATGRFTGQTFYSSTGLGVQQNTPAGLSAIEGEWDADGYRVDTETGRVVEYVPPPP